MAALQWMDKHVVHLFGVVFFSNASYFSSSNSFYDHLIIELVVDITILTDSTLLECIVEIR